MIDDEAIEAAAKAAYEEDDPWAGLDPWPHADAAAYRRFTGAALRAYHAHLEGKGLVIVPREPTKAMCRAGARASAPHGSYRAMIAAARKALT